MERYKRQMSIPQIGADGQRLLQQSTVAVVGAGGLGAPVLTYLAAAGVGNIRIIDKDTVEISNLNRQFLYGPEDVGRKKAEAAKEKLEKQNPDIKFAAVSEMLTEKNGRALFKDADVIVDCVDSMQTRIAVNKICLLNQIPLVEGGVYGFYLCIYMGMSSVYQADCNLFPGNPQNIQSIRSFFYLLWLHIINLFSSFPECSKQSYFYHNIFIPLYQKGDALHLPIKYFLFFKTKTFQCFFCRKGIFPASHFIVLRKCNFNLAYLSF